MFFFSDSISPNILKQLNGLGMKNIIVSHTITNSFKNVTKLSLLKRINPLCLKVAFPKIDN